MRPYIRPGRLLWLAAPLLLLAAGPPGIAERNSGVPAAGKKNRAKRTLPSPDLVQSKPRIVLPLSPSAGHPGTHSGFDHYYDLELDAAVSAFERAYEDYPRDPFAANHLLAAVLFRELLRVGALDSSLYSSNGFITRKEYPVDEVVRDRVQALAAHSIALCEARLDRDPDDVHALYARGVARALLAGYQGIIQRAWFTALKSARSARQDHERILELSPDFLDAKTIVGIHNYIAGSVSWTAKLALSLTGMSGNKNRGLALLAEVSGGGTDTSLVARIAEALFLRREQRYQEALPVVQQLIEQRPRNFFFALEQGNILNAAGEGLKAAAAYRGVLDAAGAGRYAQARPELAAYGLGEALRGQRQFLPAARAYDRVHGARAADAELSLRACLAAGEMYDAVGDRSHALDRYRTVLAAAPADSTFRATARRRLKEPFTLR
jgi:tetratricopeptide (TPR) repeat protein